MKKIIATIMAVCLMLSWTSVFALSPDDIFNEYTNYDSNVKLSLRIEEYPQSMTENMNDSFVDIKELIKGLSGAGYTADIKVNSSDDYKKMTMYANADFSLPLVFNDRLKVGVDASSEMWVDMDMNDSSKPVYKWIQLTPVSNKYMYVDNVFEYAELDGNDYESIKKVFDFVTDKGLRDETKEILKKNSKLTLSYNKITVTTDASGIKNTVADMLELLYEKGILKGVDSVSLASVKAMVLAFPIEEDTLIKSEYTYKNGELSLAESHFDICFDINKITAYTNKLAGMDSEEIKEDARVKIGFDVECVYNSINKPLEIPMPNLTRENSIDIAKMYNGYYDYEYVPDEFYHNEYYEVYFDVKDHNSQPGDAKIPAANLMDGLGMYSYSYDCEQKDILEIKKGWWKDDLTIKENSSQIVRNGETFSLSESVGTFEEGFSVAQIEEIFNLSFDRISFYNYETDSMGITFKNPDYVPYVYNKPYIPNTIDSWISVSVIVPEYVGHNKDAMMIDFRKVTEAFAVEESSVVNANGSINFNFYNRYITFTPGSDVIVVNGESIKIDKPVEEIEGSFKVSCDFVEKAFNCRLVRMFFDSYVSEVQSTLAFDNNSYMHIDW